MSGSSYPTINPGRDISKEPQVGLKQSCRDASRTQEETNQIKFSTQYTRVDIRIAKQACLTLRKTVIWTRLLLLYILLNQILIASTYTLPRTLEAFYLMK